MRIPGPFITIIMRNYGKYSFSTSDDFKNYFDDCFKDLIKTLNITDFQARATKTGKMFEYAFWYLIKTKFDFDMVGSVALERACLCNGGELDFGVFKKNETHLDENLLCGIEAKGSDVESSERAGLKRTDTMKKAISNAYQFKRIFPKLPFFVVTNVLPISGNARCMMGLAEGDIVDKFINITDIKDVQEFVKILKSMDK